MRRELTRGALAGSAGGAMLAVVLLAAGEGPLQRAIDREGAGGGDELVSRAGQRVGGVVAALLVGIALGVALAFVAEVRAGRARPTDPDHGVAATQAWMSSVRLAGVAFLVVNLVPLLKYPPNPPGVGDADTIGTRTGAFLALVAWSLLVAWAAGRGWRWLRRQDLPIPLAAPAVTVAAAILVGLAYLVLPAADSPNAIPAADVWSFRIATLAGWAAYWAVAGTVLGWLRLPAGVLTRARFGGARSPA